MFIYSTLKLYHYTMWWFLINHRMWFFFFIFLLTNLYQCSTELYLCDDGPENIPHEQWTNRSVKQLNQTRQYSAYDPNFVQTSQGWRTELPATQYSSRSDYNDWIHHYSSDNISRIPNPSHYPGVYPVDLHSTVTYPLGEISFAGSVDTYPLGEIEPTRSDLDRDGIYSGNSNPNIIEHTKNYRHPDTTYFERLKNRIQRGYNYVDKKIEKDLTKYSEKCVKENIKLDKMYYTKETGWLNRGDLRALNRKGYTVENSKIIKMSCYKTK